jgi:cell wall-associated NlpC family hydrolase
VVIGAGLVLACGLAAGAAQFAGAAPQPTISQVTAQVNTYQSQYDKAVQLYDQDNGQLTDAKSRLGQINTEVAAATKKYNAARKRVVQIASASFEDSGQTSLAGLLTTSDPGTVLGMASILTELTGARNQQTQTFLADAQQLSSVQQTRQHAEQGIQQLTDQAKAKRDSAQQAYDHENALLSTLTAAQRAAVQAQTIGGTQTTTHTGSTTGSGSTSSGGGTPVVAPNATQAEKAIAFVKAQLGCPYLYGGTGPCHPGFDCSGLMQAAWAYAGVSIPRTTYADWSALPHVPLSELVPGDMIEYNGEGHIAMYIGGGMIIDAPHTGLNVEEIPMSETWYADNTDGYLAV